MQSLKSKLTNLTHETEVKKLREELRQANHNLALAVDQLDKARASKIEKVTPSKTRPKLKGDIVRMILCDLHGSKMHRPSVEAVLGDVRALRPDHIILNGDMMDCGGFLAQHHTLGYVAESSYTYEDDILQSNHFLDQLRAAAPNALIEYIEGNHENRVERWALTMTLRHGGDAEGLRRRNAPEFVLNLKSRGIPYYRMSECYDGLTVPGFIRRGKIHYTHGSFVTASDAAAKIHSRVSGNVVYANTHRAQTRIVRKVGSGTIGAWNPGCLCELQPLWRNTDPSDWTHGYAVEFIAKSESFLHVNIPLVNGESLLVPLLSSNEQPA